MAIPSFGDPVLDHIYRYWLSRRRDGRPPRRSDIRPGELGAAVRHINIVEVIREPGKAMQFRHRLVGTAIIDWLGMDMTGRMLDAALYGPAAAAIAASLTRIVVTGRPFHRLAPVDWHSRKFALMESVEMPLSGEDGEIAMILRGAAYRHLSGAAPEPFFEPLALD